MRRSRVSVPPGMDVCKGMRLMLPGLYTDSSYVLSHESSTSSNVDGLLQPGRLHSDLRSTQPTARTGAGKAAAVVVASAASRGQRDRASPARRSRPGGVGAVP